MGIELGYGCGNQIYMWVLRNVFKYGFCDQCMDLVIVFGSGECVGSVNFNERCVIYFGLFSCLEREEAKKTN